MPKYVKGQSGNPAGKPKGANQPMTELLKAIKLVEKSKRKKLMVHFVEQAYKDNKVLVALMKKVLPDKKVEDINIGGQAGNPLSIVMFDDTNTKRKIHKRTASSPNKRAKRV